MKYCVPTKIVALILNCLAFVCFSAIGAADEAANVNQTQEKTTDSNSVGNLYVLNVWGTNAEDYQFFSVALEHPFGLAMLGSGLTPDSIKNVPNQNESVKVDFCKEYITLSGDNASNKNVLEACQNLSKKAAKNDVIFVYMCCHAKTVRLNGDNKRYHILFPGIKHVDETRDNNNGIMRSEIIDALKPQNHRLTVLITDTSTCSMDIKAKTVIRFHPMPSRMRFWSNNRLWLLLRTNTGLIDWNSTSPLGNDGEGEFISIYQHGRGSNFDSAPRPKNIFLDSFFEYGCGGADIKDITAVEFFNGLKKKISSEFNQCNKSIEDSDKITFQKQPTQTLFDFKGLGYVIDNGKDKNAPQKH